MFATLDQKLNFIRNAFGRSEPDRRLRDVYVRCPFCAPTSQTKKKLVIRIEDGVCHCWTCGWGSRSMAPILRKFNRSALEEHNKLYPRARGNPNWDAKVDAKLEGFVNKLRLPSGWSPLAPVGDDDYGDLDAAAPPIATFVRSRSYIKRRGLVDSDVWRFKIGVCTQPGFDDKVVFPSHGITGELEFYIGRSFISEVPGRKYLSCNEVRSKDIVFNEYLIDWTKRVTLCEGVFDAVKCGDNCVPLLGCQVYNDSLIFDRIISTGCPILLALDDDASSRTERYVRLLEEYEIDVLVADTSSGDPGSGTKANFAKLAVEAEHMTWDRMMLNRLSRKVNR